MYWNQSCYRFNGNRDTWFDAEARCKDRDINAYIAVPNSEEENSFIRTFTNRANIWIGCRDTEENGEWTCADHNEVNKHVYDENDLSSVGFWCK